MTRIFHVNGSTKGRYYMSITLPLDTDNRQSMGTQPCSLPEQWNMEEIYPHTKPGILVYKAGIRHKLDRKRKAKSDQHRL